MPSLPSSTLGNAIDERPVEHSAVPPPPISGGTLLVASDGVTAIAADPDRDRISIVDLEGGVVVHTIALVAGDEPGRLCEDDAGRVHVVLRGPGELVAIRLSDGAIMSRRRVCAAPRGVAFDPAERVLHVACASGELVTLPVDEGAPTRVRVLGADLRDVVVIDGGLLVSRFKSAQVLRLDAAGKIVTRNAPAPTLTEFREVAREPSVAWRLVADRRGGAHILYQRAIATALPGNGPGGPVYYPPPPTPPRSKGGCGGIVETTFARFDGAGDVTYGDVLKQVTLAVDAAVSPSGDTVAFALPSQGDPVPGALWPANLVVSAVEMSAEPLREDPDVGCNTPTGYAVLGQATAVAYDGRGRLVIQSREPARLYVMSDADAMAPADLEVLCANCPAPKQDGIDLGGERRRDTGHDLFHLDVGTGVTCAGCHPEGGEDGRSWRFSFGIRRTQAPNVGLEGTAPFHWDGGMPTFTALMDEVLVKRMGGLAQTPERVAALEGWVFGLHPPPPRRESTESAVERGAALFRSTGVGCAGCHAGPHLTNNETVDVGTGRALQVPSLVGIGYRAPYLHHGCAKTLRKRLDLACGGGDRHGQTSQLSDAEKDDLVAYLESL